MSSGTFKTILRLEIIGTQRIASFYYDYENTKCDSGCDIYIPFGDTIDAGSFGNKIYLGVKAAMYTEDKNGNRKSIGYMLLPRSSTGSKTPLRLSNSVGIIDSGYRGELIACVDNLSKECYNYRFGDRLFQVVPFHGMGVDTIEFGCVDDTSRGSGGFGSTGK